MSCPKNCPTGRPVKDANYNSLSALKTSFKDQCTSALRVSGSEVSDWSNPTAPPTIVPMQTVALGPLPNVTPILFNQVDFSNGCVEWDAANFAVHFKKSGVYHVDFSVNGVLVDGAGAILPTSTSAGAVASILYPAGQPVGAADAVFIDVGGPAQPLAQLSPFFQGNVISGSGDISVQKGDKIQVVGSFAGDVTQPGSNFQIIGRNNLFVLVPGTTATSSWTYLTVHKV